MRQAVEGAFCQLNHGKRTPLERLHRGDRLVYYSPKEAIRSGAPVQAFTAIGEIVDDNAYLVSTTACFHPFRRKVRYLEAREASIQPLLRYLSFSRDNPAWGRVLMRGLVQLEAVDFDLIANAMNANACSS